MDERRFPPEQRGWRRDGATEATIHTLARFWQLGPISVREAQPSMQGHQAAQRCSPYRHRRLVELYLFT
jgi:hypothetical protein